MIKYVLFIIFVLFLAVIYQKYILKYNLDNKMEDYMLIEKYFLSEDAKLQEFSNNKDIIWIYIDNKKNSRDWLSFYSRSSEKLNRPYILSCVESIINKCGNNFKIVLLDSNSFKKILPNWNVDMDLVSGSTKENVVNLGILKIMYKYGGIKLPSSTIAIKNLKYIYDISLQNKSCFCVEEINKSLYREFDKYVPGLNIIGCKKGCNIIKELILFYKNILKTDNTDNFKISGEIHKKMDNYCKDKKMNLINGKYFGIKDNDNKPVNIHMLMGETYIDFMDQMVALYIPNDELIQINNYGWFSKLSQIELRDCNNIICKHLLLGEC